MAGSKLVLQGEKRRKAILTFITKYQKKHGMAPSISEIAEGVGLGSPNATRSHLNKLVEEGKINMRPRIARSITIIPEKAS